MKVPKYRPKGKTGRIRSKAQLAAIHAALRNKDTAMFKKIKEMKRPKLVTKRTKFSLKGGKPSKWAANKVSSSKSTKDSPKVLKYNSPVQKVAHKKMRQLETLKKIKKGEFKFSMPKIPRHKRKHK